MKKFKCLLITLLVYTLSGCWDQGELEQFAFPIVIGFDKGEKDLIKVTYQIANPQQGALARTSGSQDTNPSEIITLSAPDFLSSRDLANISVTREIHFSHVKQIIISEELARSKEFELIMESTFRDRQLRRNTNVIITREKASDFIRNNDPQLERRPHKYYELMSARWEETGLMPDATINRYFELMGGHTGLFLAVLATANKEEPKFENEDEYLAGEVEKEGGNPTQMMGSAVIKDGKMIGTFTGEETRLALLLRPDSKTDTMITTYKDPLAPDYRISAMLLKTEKNKVKIDTTKKIPEVDVIVRVDVQVLNIPSKIDYVEDFKKQEILKKTVRSQLESKAKKLVERTQKEFKGEPFRWAYAVRKEFATWDEYKEYEWSKKYQDAKVNIKYEIEITGFGIQLKPTQEPEE
ncbi:Ger(x)C family spore germination protein [Bacillus sp. DJP31]|uniref:Ger(x)C family spore germination protein n=1 Tax=Bacillus sp. DJP31 TaxID=3409789 RepID=UPI003BB63F8E